MHTVSLLVWPPRPNQDDRIPACMWIDHSILIDDWLSSWTVQLIFPSFLDQKCWGVATNASVFPGRITGPSGTSSSDELRVAVGLRTCHLLKFVNSQCRTYWLFLTAVTASATLLPISASPWRVLRKGMRPLFSLLSSSSPEASLSWAGRAKR